MTKDYSSQAPIALPIGIVELGIPGTQIGAAPAVFPTTCRSNLVTVDGKPVSVTLSGSTREALAGDALTVKLCGADAAGLTLAAGTHVVLGLSGESTGIDIDQLALDSAPGGDPDASTGPGGAALAAPTPGPAPTVRVTSATATKMQLKITGATQPYWLVLGQSINKGWVASVVGSTKSLGAPMLIDGFANGWLVRPTGAHTVTVNLRWKPQTSQNIALVISAAAVIACLVLVLLSSTPSKVGARRRHPCAGSEHRRVVLGRRGGPLTRPTSPMRPTSPTRPTSPSCRTPSGRPGACHRGWLSWWRRCAGSSRVCSCPRRSSSTSSSAWLSPWAWS